MNISARTEYACLAVLELSARYDTGEPVRIRAIADAHNIPSRFLVQILLQLKNAGLVRSTRGAAGGYRLAREPNSVTLGDVMRIVDTRREDDITASTTRPTAMRDSLHSEWKRVWDAQQQMLEQVSFADLVAQTSPPEDMYYI